MPSGRARLAIAFVAALTSVGALAATATGAGLNINWTSLLPPAASPNEPQPRPVRFCREPSLRCVVVEVRRLAGAQDRFGCDHRAVFATTYLELTRQALRTMRRNPDFLRYKRWFFIEDAQFANMYFDVLRAWRRGARVPPAWRIALETARSGEVNAGQDLLLGVNAHVQNDMPFLLASIGLRTRNGTSRKRDHDIFNQVLDRAYERVVRVVRERYDPMLELTNPSWTNLEDIPFLEMVRIWREQVWRNAERLLNADSREERREVARSIESYAADWARGIALFQTPGSRERRRAYCAAQLGP